MLNELFNIVDIALGITVEPVELIDNERAENIARNPLTPEDVINASGLGIIW